MSKSAPTIADLEQKQRYLNELAFRLVEEEDPNTKVEMGKIMQAEAQELERMAKEFEKAELAKIPPIAKDRKVGFDVVLTPAQRERILADTGIRMETLWIHDPSGILNESMIYMPPEWVEERALKEAREKKGEAQAHAQAVEYAHNALAAIEEDEVSQEMLDLIEQLKQDPNFLGGLLQKK